MRLLRQNMNNLEREQKAAMKGAGFNANHAKAANALAAALSKLVSEMRKLEDSSLRKVAKMSFEEKVDVFLGMFRDLPREHQLDALERASEIFHSGPNGQLQILADPELADREEN